MDSNFFHFVAVVPIVGHTWACVQHILKCALGMLVFPTCMEMKWEVCVHFGTIINETAPCCRITEATLHGSKLHTKSFGFVFSYFEVNTNSSRCCFTKCMISYLMKRTLQHSLIPVTKHNLNKFTRSYP